MSYFHSRKKAGVDPGILPQLRWSSVWQVCLICFCKGTEEFDRYTCHSIKKNTFLLGHLKTFNVKALRILKSS